MGRNVEIKARVGDPASLRRRVAKVATEGPWRSSQEDIFFASRRGRLKLRRDPDRDAELIYYERRDAADPEVSHYWKVLCPEPEALEEGLSRALGVRAVVRKTRTIYRAGRTRIHLDEVEGLGSFLELEVVLQPGESVPDGRRAARELMARLGIREEELVPEAYVDLLCNSDEPRGASRSC